MIMPFGTAAQRDGWATQHPHDVNVGIEIRR
jgi:hypothetical protein